MSSQALSFLFKFLIFLLRLGRSNVVASGLGRPDPIPEISFLFQGGGGGVKSRYFLTFRKLYPKVYQEVFYEKKTANHENLIQHL